MAWNDLTLSDKARMINLAVKSGITDLRTIKNVYNSFDEGGEVETVTKEIPVRYPRNFKNDFSAAIGNPEKFGAELKNRAKSINAARSFASDYYNSPGYKRRAAESGLTEDYPLIDFTVVPNPNVGTEGSVFDYRNKQALIGIGNTGYSDSAYPGHYSSLYGTALHEIGHANKNYRMNLVPNEGGQGVKYGVTAPAESQEILGRFNKNVKADDHDNKVNEAYSDLLELRGLLKSSGTFDSTDENAIFDKSMLKDFKKSHKGIMPRFIETHDDDTVIEAINKVAYNQPKKDTMGFSTDFSNIAALGGDIDINKFHSPYWNPPKQRKPQVPYRAQKVSDDELAEAYVQNVLWKMENPREKGYNKEDKKYYSYTDKDAQGRTHTNIGPGLEKSGHPNINYNQGYTRPEVDSISEITVRDRIDKMTRSLQEMNNSKYAETRDTLSMGPLLALVDIAYNGRTTGKRNLPEKWPTLVKNLAEGDLEAAKTQTYSGSKRRQRMRNDLLTYGPITSKTVKNR